MTHTSSILVVDDEPDSLSLLTSILTAEGYHVRTSDSGRLALASVAAWLPDLILLDIRMPGMDGFEVCRRLKTADNSRCVPIIFITAAGEVDERVKGLDIGAVDYIGKPFHREELLARVRTHLELARLRAELEKQVSERTAELSAAVDRLRESEQRFRNMANAAPVMIWVSGIDKLCTFFNKTWLTFTGRSMEEEQGDGWSKGMHPDELERCLGIYTSAFDARQEFQMEYRLRQADGEFRWVLDNGIPFFAPSGAFAGYIGSAIDITDLKRIQEEALSKQKLETLSSLTRGISHDFNNMVSAILAQAELAEDDLAARLLPTEEVHQIKAVAVRASEMVRQLMIYSGQQEATLEPLDLSELIEEMSDLLKASVSRKSSLHFDLARGLPPISGNAVQIRQLVLNLAINASQAIGEQDGRVHIKTSSTTGTAQAGPKHFRDPREDSVRLEVSDTGRGMTEKEKAKIFDPFFTTKPGGHGLGLAVVQGIAHSHNAPINVISAPGKGAAFEVLFRRAGERPAIAPSALVAESKIQAVSGTVLLVEDEDQLRLATATALQNTGISVISAADGPSAIEAFRDRVNEISVAVLDVMLPGLSGQEVFRQIRAIKPDVKVIFTSAYDLKNVDVALVDQGIVRFLQKPYRLSDLTRELQHAISEPPKAAAANRPR
jgi:two-component system, cell cycle sensor histidine kinase and response regulator CckA